MRFFTVKGQHEATANLYYLTFSIVGSCFRNCITGWFSPHHITDIFQCFLSDLPAVQVTHVFRVL